MLYSWPSIHKIPCKYSHVDQSYSNFEFSVAAILKIQNGGRYSSQITCLHFLYDSNNKKLSIHQISCFYDNLNNIATNRSTTYSNGDQTNIYALLLTEKKNIKLWNMLKKTFRVHWKYQAPLEVNWSLP